MKIYVALRVLFLYVRSTYCEGRAVLYGDEEVEKSPRRRLET
jgi:hypothetical protein